MLYVVKGFLLWLMYSILFCPVDSYLLLLPPSDSSMQNCVVKEILPLVKHKCQ